mgnify:CR=1 FL=1
MRWFLWFLLGGASLPAFAQDPPAVASWHLVAQLYSLHEHTIRTDLTNNTPGLGIMRRTPDHWLLGGGVFRNSVGRTAGYVYVGKQWPFGRVYAGGITGATHRYNYNDGGIVPLGALSVTVPLNRDWSLELLGIPRIRDYTYTTLHFAVSWRFR